MGIPRETAMQIVTEISGLIDQQVNMMNENGVIIASTDKARIGTYHAAASRIISDKMEFLSVSDDSEYEGSKRGINLPVMLEEKILGVIGITGEYHEVGRYGQIVKKMTEILLRENYLSEQKALDSKIISRFFNDWLYDTELEYSTSLIERGKHFGIDIVRPRRVLVAELADFAKYRDSVDGQQMIDNINRMVRRVTEGMPGGIFTKTESSMVCLVYDCSDDKMRTFANNLQTSIKNFYGQHICIGIDEPAHTIGLGYERAKKALKAIQNSSGSICFYNNITFELFMDEIRLGSKEEYIKQVFYGCSISEINNWIKLLQVYYKNNGSISKTSERLYIHENTLQYKLKRLKHLTGHDPRKVTDAALFITAIQFYENISEDSSAFSGGV